MGSTRLPGKVLKPLRGVPVIERILDQLRRCKTVTQLVVATSNLDADNALCDFLAGLDVPVFRGSEEDVLDRYVQCAREYGFTSIVRATGDNPFVDPFELDNLAEVFLDQKLDYVSGTSDMGSKLPVGIGAEILSLMALESSWKMSTDRRHREHINEYILDNKSAFRSNYIPCAKENAAPELSFTIDTQEDFDRVERLLCEIEERGLEVTTQNLIAVALSLVH